MWGPLLLTILGSQMQNRAIKQGEKRGRNEAARGRETQRGLESDRQAEVFKALEKFDPTARQEAMDTQAEGTRSNIESALAGAAEQAATPGNVGRVSEKTLEQRAASTREQANRASVLAALLSKVRAPGEVATDEAADKLRTATNVSGIDRTGRRAANTTQLLTELVSQPSRRTMAAGGLAQGIGTSMLSGQIMGALGTPGGAPAVTPGANVYPSADPQVYGNWLRG